MTEIRDPHYHLEGNGSLTVCWADESGPHEMHVQGERARTFFAAINSEPDEDGRAELLRQIIRMREGV